VLSAYDVPVQRLGITGEFLSFIIHGKRWWMAPVIGMLILVVGFVVLAESSAVAPFIYSLF
jgi:uncharacterized protein DUF5989